jgi:hypothetical protein
MLSEDFEQIITECPDGYQDKLESLDEEEINNRRSQLETAARMAANNCNISVKQIKSKKFFEKFEQHQESREDLLQFFVMWTQDQTRPKSAGELAQQLECVIMDFEAETNANFSDFFRSNFPNEEKEIVMRSLILTAIYNGD